MIKKVWLFILSFIAIFSVWVSIADIIPDDSHRIDKCVKIENTTFGWYRAVQVLDGICYNEKKVYEVEENECLEQHYHACDSYIYLIPNSKVIKWKNWILELLRNNSILVGEINPNGGYYFNSDWLYNGVNSITEEYEIIKSNWKYGLKLTKKYDSDTNESFLEDWENSENLEEFSEKLPKSYIPIKLISFAIARLFTIFIETLILFLTAKFWRKSWSFKNRRLIITWIIASTVTLPLLWFVLPIFFSNYWVYVIFWEILVTIIETFIIKYSLKVERKMAIFASIVCNLCSFIIWLFIF